jgi:hypothetical protein
LNTLDLDKWFEDDELLKCQPAVKEADSSPAEVDAARPLPELRAGSPAKRRPASSASGLMPHFQLITVDGDVLGARELSGPDWRPGSVIYTGPNEPNLRVVRILDTENDDPKMHFAVLVVEKAD